MPAIKKRFKPGDVIFSEGSLGNTFYFIEQGKIEVSRTVAGKKEVLDELSAGATFGEYALLSKEKTRRSATVTVLENAELVIMDETTLENVLQNVPKSVIALIRNTVSKLLSLEDRYFKAESRCENLNLTYLTEILSEKRQSMLKNFPVYLKKYSLEERSEILDYMERIIAVCRKIYQLEDEVKSSGKK
ncbi:MAG TPA: cyclic nucleotide-binding domain-containing protein [archaeon]|nr:cyclic nucleotide-binding domain-containing protein [archaeon]